MPAPRELKSVFLILFIDLMGFSIIFPLFPKMLNYYLEHDAGGGLLSHFMNWVIQIESWIGVNQDPKLRVVLFGGIMGAIYSVLQFFFSPIWGSLSDRYGRKPILMISLVGMVASYALWAFAGSFELVVLSRLVSGIMSGNISTATAVVSDVTPPDKRSSGMAVLGIAFALGFILGPAFGGILSKWDLTVIQPAWQAWGVNPFTLPALFALTLSLINFGLVTFHFRETLKPGTRGQRVFNPLAVFQLRDFPKAFWVCMTYFFFLIVFSGMEFSLSFLADQRFGLEPQQLAYIFVYIGIIMTLVQGGFVRRYARRIGEARLARIGIALIIPGLVLVGFSAQLWQLFLGTTFLSVGSALVTPTLTTLASLTASGETQGRVLGVFRATGALARAFGPLLAAIIYWRFGPQWGYGLGAIGLLVPLFMSRKFPRDDAHADAHA